MNNFLDEAGNFKGDKEGIFIVGGFTTGDFKRTAKIFRKWQYSKFLNNKLRFRTEVKFSDSRLTETLSLLFPTADSEFRIFLDQRQLKGISQSEFKEILKLDLLAKLPAKAALEIQTFDSTTSPNIQIADWICGALYRYHANRSNGKEFFDIIYNNIVVSKELFKNYWQSFCKNKQKQKTPHRS